MARTLHGLCWPLRYNYNYDSKSNESDFHIAIETENEGVTKQITYILECVCKDIMDICELVGDDTERTTRLIKYASDINYYAHPVATNEVKENE